MNRHLKLITKDTTDHFIHSNQAHKSKPIEKYVVQLHLPEVTEDLFFLIQNLIKNVKFHIRELHWQGREERQRAGNCCNDDL